jgi:hypothetical protein
VSKFVGKFRKNKNYNDDYNFDYKRHRNEHSESKKLLQRMVDENEEMEYDVLYENNKAA